MGFTVTVKHACSVCAFGMDPCRELVVSPNISHGSMRRALEALEAAAILADRELPWDLMWALHPGQNGVVLSLGQVVHSLPRMLAVMDTMHRLEPELWVLDTLVLAMRHTMRTGGILVLS